MSAPGALTSDPNGGQLPEIFPYFETISRGLRERMSQLPGGARNLSWDVVAPLLELLLNGAEVGAVAGRSGVDQRALEGWYRAAQEAGVYSAAQSAGTVLELVRGHEAEGSTERRRDWLGGGFEGEVFPRLVKEGDTASVWLLEPTLVTGREDPGSRLLCLAVARDAEGSRELAGPAVIDQPPGAASRSGSGHSLGSRTVRWRHGHRDLSVVVGLRTWTPGRELRVDTTHSGERAVATRLLEVDRNPTAARHPLSPLQAARSWRHLIAFAIGSARLRLQADGTLVVTMSLPDFERGGAIHQDGQAVVNGLGLTEVVLPLPAWVTYLKEPWLLSGSGLAVHWPIRQAMDPTVRLALLRNPRLEGNDPAAIRAREALTRAGLVPPRQ